jgi:hypothetical protein
VTACAFAAGALTSIFMFGKRLLGAFSALLLTVLTALYPIWFAQSSLAHADIFAACFSLAGIGLVLTAPEVVDHGSQQHSSSKRLGLAALMFCLSVLSKETAVVQPVTLAGLTLLSLLTARHSQQPALAQKRWFLALTACLPVLAIWYAYHFYKTGQIFGNPVFLRYNATANLTGAHILYAFRIRLLHLGWQRNLWVPIALALACLLLPRQANFLPKEVLITIATLTVANLIAFSILGGALLTRYLLPVYPLILLVCISKWREHTSRWPWFGVITGLAFASAIWVNPWAFFAPEDNLTYRDLIVVQQNAIKVLDQSYPDATVLTAWPASASLFRPELGYTNHRFKVFSVDDFTKPELLRAAQQPGRFDTALIFTTHYLVPSFRRFLVTHPNSWRGRRYGPQLDLRPSEVARLLGGSIVWQEDRNGEWAAIIRFNRSYVAQELNPVLPRLPNRLGSVPR